MDPKLFAAAQQGMAMNNPQNQPNPNMMMSPFQQQQQQQQPDMQQFNPLAQAGLGGGIPPFNPANLGGGNMGFGQADFGGPNGGGLDQTDLSSMNPFIQANPSLMNGMNMAAAASPQQHLQQQHLRQTSHPQNAYSPLNLMALQQNSPAALQAQFQNRGMYQNNGNMMANIPQALMFQQQQQAAMAMNRAKQSPSQSPALNNAHFPGNAVGSPVIGNSPHMAGTRMGGSDYAVSPMNPNVGSPVQNFQPQGNGISPSPQMSRVIPSQANNNNNNRYNMQQMNVQQQQQAMMQQQQQQNSPSINNNYASPQQQQQQQPQDTNMMEDQLKNFNNNSSPMGAGPSPFVQQQQQQQQQQQSQQSPMQASSSPIPRQSATPGSTHSTPHQQHQQIDQVVGTPHLSPAINKRVDTSTPSNNQITSPSPKPTTSVPASPIGPQQVQQQQHNDGGVDSPYSIQQQQQQQPQPPKPQITYIPKTRNVETYGGVDLKYFDKFEIKPPVAHLNELGLIDIQALIMSMKSGLKMELTNALNVLTMLTVQPQVQQQGNNLPHLPLVQCDDLLDVLLDYLEQDIFGTNTRFAIDQREQERSSDSKEEEDQQILSDLTYTDLFDMSLDEMKSLIPQLENSTSDVWISLRERCLCIFNILRNISFMNENMEYLARHTRFITLMIRIVDNTRIVSAIEGRDTTGKEAWFVGIRRMDTLDFRKSILMIFSNISMFLNLQDQHTATVFVQLIHDFLVNGPDTYYSLLSIETWTKLTVNYENRQLLHSLINNAKIFNLLEEIWLELTAVIRRDFFSTDGRVMHAMTSNQLATLELTIIGLYNIVAIVENESLKQQLVQRNKSVGMMIMRLCITLAESGNPQFGLATKRGMELIRALVCGGDGIRRRSNANRDQKGGSTTTALQALSTSQYKPLQDSNGVGVEEWLSISEIANRILDMPVVREKLMLSMLKPTTDPEILRELSDIVTLIDEDSIATV